MSHRSLFLSELERLKEELQRREEKENRVETVKMKTSVVEELKERRGRKQEQEGRNNRELEAVERLREEKEGNTQVRPF